MSYPIRVSVLESSLNLVESSPIPTIQNRGLQLQNQNQQKEEKLSLYAHARVQWLLSHHFPSKIRKSKLLIVVTSPARGHLKIKIQKQPTSRRNSNGNDDGEIKSKNIAEESCGINYDNNSFLEREKDQLEKSIHTALKKISIEDLGNMNAIELQSSIPEKDSEGRGMNDLHDLEKKLSVKVIFDDVTNHVLLVGEKKKLEKKVIVIRNMLSHYHWRLSGSDNTFQHSASAFK